MLEDIAILTGGQVVSEDIGIKLENVTINDLGQAKRVVSTRTTPPSLTAPATRTSWKGGSSRSGPDRGNHLRL
jgi:hypothetical protein